MKIGLFIPNATFDLPGSSEVGGIEVYAFELGEALQNLGNEVVLFGGTPKQGRSHRPTSVALQLSPYIETKAIWKLGTRFRKLVQRLHFAGTSLKNVKAANPDVMIVFKPYDFINAARWKRHLPGLRVVMNYQGKDFFPTDRWWHRAIDWEYAASAENATLAEQRYGSRPEVSSNGVDTSLFYPAREKKQSGRLKLLTAGRLVGWKGLVTLLPVLAALPELEWHVAGDGPQRADLEKTAKELKIADRIQFHGVLEAPQLAVLMREVDLFVQPSIDFDACPTAVLQAMSAGLPTLISDQVGHQSSFKAPEEIRVCPARNTDAWISSFQQILNLTPEALQTWGFAARIAIEKRFAWKIVAAQLEDRLKALF